VGRGALAVVGVLGADAARLVARLFAPRGARPLHDADRHGEQNGVAEVRFGRWIGHAGGVGEDVVAVVRPGGDRIEVHCHGGTAAAEGVITSLEAAGARRVSWHHWLASLGEADWAIEVRESLARVRGPKAARILSRQLAGAWDAAWRRLLAAAEADRVSEVVADGTRLLAAARVGLRLTRPWRVVLVGRVNVGKSSLVNALAGHARCIVTPVPGTTRDLVETRLVLDGWEIDLVDTAGLRPGDEPVDAVERAGIERAIAAAAAADLVVRVVSADGDEPAATASPHQLLVRSRADLAVQGGATGMEAADSLTTSAVTGLGIAALAAAIVARLVPEEHDDPALFTGAVPVTPRQADALRDLVRSAGSTRP
jgi:tRNA modification GTPase